MPPSLSGDYHGMHKPVSQRASTTSTPQSNWHLLRRVSIATARRAALALLHGSQCPGGWGAVYCPRRHFSLQPGE